MEKTQLVESGEVKLDNKRTDLHSELVGKVVLWWLGACLFVYYREDLNHIRNGNQLKKARGG